MSDRDDGGIIERMKAGLSQLSAPAQTSPHACVFYASNNTYALAVLVFVKLLRRVGMDSHFDIVLIHNPISPGLLEQIRDSGIIASEAATPRKLSHAYYRDCLLKLRIFELTRYERIVYVDADAIPLRGFDALFSMPMSHRVAAPIAYWLPHHYWTSGLLVVRPSEHTSKRVMARLEAHSGEDVFDMDIINAEFRDEIQSLPVDWFCLDSEWEVADRPGYFAARPDIKEMLFVVHFSTLSKPWGYPPAKVHCLRPNADPFYYELRNTWWDAMNDILSRLPRSLRTGLSVSRFLGSYTPIRNWY